MGRQPEALNRDSRHDATSGSAESGSTPAGRCCAPILRSSALPVADESGHAGCVTGIVVMQSSAIGAGDDCCDRGRSRSSRALWRRAALRRRPVSRRLPHWLRWSRSRRGRDRRRPGIWASYDGRLLTDTRGVAASRPPRRTQWQKRRGDLSRSRSQAVKHQPAFVCQRH